MVSRQFLVFCTVGGISAFIDIGIMQALVYSGIHYGIAASSGFLISLIFNFICQAKLTFKAISSRATFFRFGCIVVMNYLLTMAFVAGGQHFFGQSLIGKVLSLPIIAINSFLWSRYWVFSRA
jgi:putative flippase GtrA